MGRSYLRELAELPRTYNAAIRGELAGGVRPALGGDRPMVFVGSGGALAAAQLAADLHMHTTGHLAAAMTPLEASTAQLGPKTGLTLFTARGRNPDATLAINTARSRGTAHLGVISTKGGDDLPSALTGNYISLGTVPAAADGFLATNSLLAMTAAVCRAHGAPLPATLPAFTAGYRATRRSVVVINGPGARAVSIDLETRLVETGLANVQMADYRNLAHGRHVGLRRNASELTLVAAIDPRCVEIAARTLRLLPPNFDVVTLQSALEWPTSILDLLVSSMRLVASTGQDHGVDPGRPYVAEFGRRLYRMSIRKFVDVADPHPVHKKVGRRTRIDSTPWKAYRDSLTKWLKASTQTDIGAVVLDYDGTICSTTERRHLPRAEVQEQILRLLEAGLVVGFATGRGQSLHKATRAWIPERFWGRIHVGLYNGSRLLRLSDEPPTSHACGEHLVEAADRLESIAEFQELRISRRPTQLSVSHQTGMVSGARLLSIVQSVLNRSPHLLLKAVASGHSVDILDLLHGKASVLESVSRTSMGTILAIGDQGQVGGNDYEMLAALTTTLSVDQCSQDPTRCWNLDQRGYVGPELLVRYLRALNIRRSVARFLWKVR